MIRTAANIIARAGIYTGAIALLVGLALRIPDLQADGARFALDSAILALWTKGTNRHGG